MRAHRVLKSSREPRLVQLGGQNTEQPHHDLEVRQRAAARRRKFVRACGQRAYTESRKHRRARARTGHARRPAHRLQRELLSLPLGVEKPCSDPRVEQRSWLAPATAARQRPQWKRARARDTEYARTPDHARTSRASSPARRTTPSRRSGTPSAPSGAASTFRASSHPPQAANRRRTGEAATRRRPRETRRRRRCPRGTPCVRTSPVASPAPRRRPPARRTRQGTRHRRQRYESRWFQGAERILRDTCTHARTHKYAKHVRESRNNSHVRAPGQNKHEHTNNCALSPRPTLQEGHWPCSRSGGCG